MSNRRNRCCAAAQPALNPIAQGPLSGPSSCLETFMSKTLPVPADTRPSEPCLVVFGRDEAGKPHASWFDAASAELAVKAADLMNMRVLKVETEEHKALARQLAPGRVFASGRAFTPFARANLYSKLVELAGGATGLTAVQASTEGTADLAHLGPTTSRWTACRPSRRRSTSQTVPRPIRPRRANLLHRRPRPESWDEIGVGS